MFLFMGLFLEAQVVFAKKDKTPPTGSIVINNDDEFTDSVLVVLSLAAEDPESGIKEVRYSNELQVSGENDQLTSFPC